MSDKVRSRLMIAGAAFCAALFLFSGAMLAREYLDQKQSAEAFEEVAELVKEDTELPSLEAADTPEQAPKEVTAFEKYAEVYAQNSDLVGWISIPSFGEYEVVAAFKTVAYSEDGFKYYHFVHAESAGAFYEYIVVAKKIEA